MNTVSFSYLLPMFISFIKHKPAFVRNYTYAIMDLLIGLVIDLPETCGQFYHSSTQPPYEFPRLSLSWSGDMTNLRSKCCHWCLIKGFSPTKRCYALVGSGNARVWHVFPFPVNYR